jgi:hypothetical protein
VRGADGRYSWVTTGEKEPIYPEMQNMEEVLEMKEEIIADPLQGLSTWMAQYELKIVDDLTATFKRKQIEHPKFYFTDDDLVDIPLAFSLALDPATGEAQQADDAVFTVRALDQEGYWYFVEVFGSSNMDEEEVAKKYIYFLEKYPIDICTIEGISFARIYKRIIEKLCEEKKIFFPYVALPSGHSNANKINSEMKIRGLAPFYSIGKLRFRKGCPYTEKLLDQLWRFPKASHDDYPDSASMHLHLPLIPTRIWRPSEAVIIPDKNIGRYGKKINNTKAGKYI